jgi:radical SAM protein with 4Fe4S-binding SPASM domain
MNLSMALDSQVELTQECNHNCNYCYNYFRCDNPKSPMSRDTLDRIVSQFDQHDIFSVTLTGGEPFKVPNLLFYAINQFNERNIDVSINTNLSLLSKQHLRRLKQLRLNTILVSFPSYKEEEFNRITSSQNYRKVVANLGKLTEQHLPLSISMVVTKENVNDVYQTGKFLHYLGVNHLCATPINPCRASHESHQNLALNGEEIKKVLTDLVTLESDFGMRVDTLEPIPHCLIFHNEDLERFIQRKCCAGSSTLTIDSNGNVRPCSHVDVDYGNIMQEDLRDIWSKMSDWRNGDYIPQECSDCDGKEKCLGGCRTTAYSMTGRLQDKNPYMTEPLHLSTISDKETQSINTKTTFEFDGNLRFRREGNEYLLYRTSSSMALLSSDGLDVVRSLYGTKRRFSVNDFQTSKKGELIKLFNYLNVMGIIKKIE